MLNVSQYLLFTVKVNLQSVIVFECKLRLHTHNLCYHSAVCHLFIQGYFILAQKFGRRFFAYEVTLATVLREVCPIDVASDERIKIIVLSTELGAFTDSCYERDN